MCYNFFKYESLTYETSTTQILQCSMPFKIFSKVASTFKVSQPTVSYAIKSLEEDLGVQLILRNQSHTDVSLTKEGELFLESIHSMPFNSWTWE